MLKIRLSFLSSLLLLCLFSTSPLCWSQEAGKIITLPPPSYKGEVSLEEAIFRRKSIRRYRDEALSLQEISQLLWAAGGKTIDGVTGPTRAYPSAGGIYPIEIYVVIGKVEGIKAGVYRYNWWNHYIKMVKEGDKRFELMRVSLNQRMIGDAPVSFVFIANYFDTRRRYGKRGEIRYVPMDVGGAGENLSLQAVALGLGTVIIGAFNDEAVKMLLGVRDKTPLYIMPVGKPK
ncbi:MAG TPA: SagB/ThcOx family dehydrogenase [Candidatus Omnitrophica bacterium]|nr:SagB/ThcOx family dehydrogenase [Candidatus Omnitrophota bacterium]